MYRIASAACAAFVVAGCATPFDERWDDVSPRGELPAWVSDAWTPTEAHDATPAASAGADTAPESLAELIESSLDDHPAVQAAEARWHAARQRIVQARTLPEPELSYRVSVDQIDTEGEPIGHTVGIMQMFPWFGTLEEAARVKSAEARAAAQQHVQQQLAVAAAIKQAWAEYAYLHAAVEIYREQEELLQQIESVVRMRFRTGEVEQRDLVRVEAELDRVMTDRRDTEDMIVAAKARLNAAAGRAADAPLPGQPGIPSHEFDHTINVEALAEALARLNPSLERLRHELAAHRHAKALAEKEFYPDLTLGIEYGANTSRRMADNERRAGRPGGGTDMLAGRIGLRLPIWRDSYAAGVREAMARWGATLRELEDRGNMLEAELKTMMYGIRDAERRAELFGGRLRIRAEQVLHSTEAAYRTGEANFTDLIESQRELLAYELAAIRAEADGFQQMASLEALVGQSFELKNTDNTP